MISSWLGSSFLAFTSTCSRTPTLPKSWLEEPTRADPHLRELGGYLPCPSGSRGTPRPGPGWHRSVAPWRSGCPRPGCEPCRRGHSQGSAGRARGPGIGRAGAARFPATRAGLRFRRFSGACRRARRRRISAAMLTAVWPRLGSTDAGSERYWSAMRPASAKSPSSSVEGEKRRSARATHAYWANRLEREGRAWRRGAKVRRIQAARRFPSGFAATIALELIAPFAAERLPLRDRP